MFLSEIVMISVLIITLFLVDPSITIISLIFFLSLSILLHYILKKKIHQYGIIKEKLEISINKSTLQTFQSIKEIKIYNSSNFFIKLFDKIISEHSKKDDKIIINYISDIANKLKPYGSCNLQLRIDKKGVPKLFEINPRHSGTTYIRSLFGFNEVLYIINYIIKGKETEMVLKEGRAIRFFDEKIIE